MTGADTLDEARKGGPPGIVLSSNGLGVTSENAQTLRNKERNNARS